MLSRFKHRGINSSRARHLWTTSTYIATSAEALVDRLPSPSTASASAPAVNVYTVSKNIPTSLHERIYSTVAQSTSIGVVSEVLPSSALHHLAPSLQVGADLEPYSVAIASYTPTGNSRAIPFQSSLTGRPNISLGREHKPDPRGGTRAHTQGQQDVDAGLEAFLSGKKWGFGDNVNLQEGRTATIAELEGVPPDQVKQLVFFTADRIQPFLGAISSFPSAAKVGLVGSSTPFHSPSGSPYALFYDAETSSTGAVGVAIVDSKPAPRVSLDYAGFEPFGEIVQVTSAKGNIVLTLDEQNAARLLLGTVQALPTAAEGTATAARRSEEKERGVYAAVFDHKPEHPLDLSTARHVSQIMAGDPSRGAVSVETEEEVETGYYIAFLHRPHSASTTTTSTSADTTSISAVLKPLQPHTISFLSIAPSYSPPQSQSQSSSGSRSAEARAENVVILDAFVAASENGVIVSKAGGQEGRSEGGGGGGSWVCAIEGVGQRLG